MRLRFLFQVTLQRVRIRSRRALSTLARKELVAAYNELRNELAYKHFNKPFDELDNQKQKVIKMVFPNHISEIPPKNIKNL